MAQAEEEQIIKNLIACIDDNPEREGLAETPKRVIKSFKELYGGYGQDPKDILKEFDGEEYDEMVLLRDCEMFSTCEHHMLPFFGKVHIAYIPDKKVVGISKLARLVEIYSRRLQIQERLTKQITDALMEHLKPKGAACVIEATHFCMRARGVGKQNSVMKTSSLKGVFKEKPEVRQEFMGLIRGN